MKSYFLLLFWALTSVLKAANPTPPILDKKGLLVFLNNLRTLESAFIERSRQGTRLGTLALSRPPKRFGQVRLTYQSAQSATPRLELISQEKVLHVFDYKNATHETVGLEVTPLMLLLRPHIRFGNLVQADTPVFDGTYFVCRVYDPSTPDAYVELFLTFSKHGLELKRWRIHDLQGNDTYIILKAPLINHPLKVPIVVPRNPFSKETP